LKPEDDFHSRGNRLALLNRDDAGALILPALFSPTKHPGERIEGGRYSEQNTDITPDPEMGLCEVPGSNKPIASQRANKSDEDEACREHGQENRNHNQLGPGGQTGMHQDAFRSFEDGRPGESIQAEACDVDRQARLEVEGGTKFGSSSPDPETVLCTRWVLTMEAA